MVEANKFILEQNLLRFSSRLPSEADPATRQTLRRLLIEEEDRYGKLNERLERAEMLILSWQGHVQRQQALVASLKLDGRDPSRADELLRSMRESLAIFERYRNNLVELIDNPPTQALF